MSENTGVCCASNMSDNVSGHIGYPNVITELKLVDVDEME